jgi:hypothetical protein
MLADVAGGPRLYTEEAEKAAEEEEEEKVLRGLWRQLKAAPPSLLDRADKNCLVSLLKDDVVFQAIHLLN